VLLEERYKAFYAISYCKRLLAGFVVKAFMRKYVAKKGTKAIASRFLIHGMSITEAYEYTFENLSERLRVDTVVHASGEMLLRIIKLINHGRGSPLISGTVNIKIYLAAYMIALRPEFVFETRDTLEYALIDATMPMLVGWHKAIDALADGIPWFQVLRDLVPNMGQLLCTYLRTFKVLEKSLGFFVYIYYDLESRVASR
jgi:hypothetical protein